MIVPAVELLVTEHSHQLGLVQVPSVVRLRVYPLIIWLSVMSVSSLVNVGTICSPAESAYAFRGSVVVHSKEPVPKPSVWTSKFQLFGSMPFWKVSSNWRQY